MMQLKVDCFVEDDGHRLIVGALIERLFAQDGYIVKMNFRNTTGGRPKVFSSLTEIVSEIDCGTMATPEILVVAIDGNCIKFGQTKKNIDAAIDPTPSSLIIRPFLTLISSDGFYLTRMLSRTLWEEAAISQITSARKTAIRIFFLTQYRKAALRRNSMVLNMPNRLSRI